MVSGIRLLRSLSGPMTNAALAAFFSWSDRRVRIISIGQGVISIGLYRELADRKSLCCS